MAYKRKEIFEKAKTALDKNPLLFVEDIIAYLPCDRSTFYRMFPPECDEYDTLKEKLEINRIRTKTELRKKWFSSKAPALQMGLMKLLATPEEHKRLSMQFIESENTNTNKNFDITKLYKGNDNKDVKGT